METRDSATPIVTKQSLKDRGRQLTETDIRRFIEEIVTIPDTILDIHPVSPNPIKPRFRVQFFRLNFRKHHDPNVTRDGSDFKWVKSMFVKVTNHHGTLKLEDITSGKNKKTVIT